MFDSFSTASSSSSPLSIADVDLSTLEFVPLKQLGQGGFSCTFLAKWKRTNQPFAIKVLDLEGQNSDLHYLVER